MPSAPTATSDVAIFGRLLEPDNEELTPDVARFILRIDFRPEDRVRMHELAAKAREGALSPAEQEEINSYERVGHLLSVLRSRARRALKHARNGS